MSSEHGVWWPGFIGSSVTAVTFLIIAALLATALSRGQQWRQNPLAVGTCFIFLSCGGGHLVHSLQLLYPLLGGDAAIGAAARLHYSEWHLWLADGLTAMAGTAYLLLRKRFPGMVSGASMYEDLRIKQKQAMTLHDEVVQKLIAAKWHLDLDQRADARAALEAARAASSKMEATA